jgi:hypothetical protein
MDDCDIEPGVDFVTAWKPNGWWSGYLDLTVMFPTTKSFPRLQILRDRITRIQAPKRIASRVNQMPDAAGATD